MLVPPSYDVEVKGFDAEFTLVILECFPNLSAGSVYLVSTLYLYDEIDFAVYERKYVFKTRYGVVSTVEFVFV